MNEKIYERVKIPTEVHVVFERRLIVGTHTERDEAIRRASQRAAFGAVRRTFVAKDQHRVLRDALEKLKASFTPGSSEWATATAAIQRDDTFEWFSE